MSSSLFDAASSGDPALQALRLPFASDALPWPPGRDGRALFLRGRVGWPSHAPAAVACEQPYKPEADALRAAGHALLAEDDTARFDAVLLLPPRQREEMRALYARAFDRCASGGVVVASAANDAGAKSAEADFRRIVGLDGSLSKYHCRVFWVRRDEARIDHALLDQWRMLDAPREIAAPALPQGRFLSRPGVFAWDRIDPASALLAAHLPETLEGDGADLGAGWGYLAIETLRRASRVRALDLYEADARALELARANLATLPTQARVEFHWHDVTAGLPRRYDFIVCNPPFHAQGRADRPELGQRFIAVAADALRPGGRLYLVANRHLPYEAALASRFAQVRVLDARAGFKAIEAVRAR